MSRHQEFDGAEQMKRVVSLMHRQAVRARAEGLFFKVQRLWNFTTEGGLIQPPVRFQPSISFGPYLANGRRSQRTSAIRTSSILSPTCSGSSSRLSRRTIWSSLKCALSCYAILFHAYRKYDDRPSTQRTVGYGRISPAGSLLNRSGKWKMAGVEMEMEVVRKT